MRLALPEHQGRIAPVFDTGRRLLVFDQVDHRAVMICDEDWSEVTRQHRPVRLKELKVEVLLCGGISCDMENRIRMLGIRITAWLAGDVPKILTAFRDGTIMDPDYAMPGTLLCRRFRQTRRCCRDRNDLKVS
jgi:hypothetical protein